MSVFRVNPKPRRTDPANSHRSGKNSARSVWITRRVLHAPQRLRAMVRADEIWLIGLAAVIGAIGGLLVALMNWSTLSAHRLFFGLTNDGHLSGLTSVDPMRSLLVPALGGLALGVFTRFVGQFVAHRPVDPIEANALHGGRMSIRDSLLVATQTTISNSVGASIGLEAGFTQISSAIGSWVGRVFRVRREDLRMLVGCGAAGAIAAAFDAPLAGAFYAFELVIGTYSLASLAPVAIASVMAIGVTHLLHTVPEIIEVAAPNSIPARAYVPVVVLGILCAVIGIGVMRLVTLTEAAFRRSGLPVWLRPFVGGALVGGLSLISPSVFSAGHSAMRAGFDGGIDLRWAVVLLLMKAVASSLSIGSGFRGGLFFASLYLGVLTGVIFEGVLSLFGVTEIGGAVFAVVGMAGMAVAIIGGPMTMVFLTLEMTASLPLTIVVLVAAVLSALTVRRTFGYSFATWRFHLRGEAIRSAVDMSWMRSLSVGRMMRAGGRTLVPETPVWRAREMFPLGSGQRVVLADEYGRYRGLVLVPEVHAHDLNADVAVSNVAHYLDVMLTPEMNVREAITRFEEAEADALVVVHDTEKRTVMGILTEQHALRRYSEELDRTRKDLAGEARSSH